MFLVFGVIFTAVLVHHRHRQLQPSIWTPSIGPTHGPDWPRCVSMYEIVNGVHTYTFDAPGFPHGSLCCDSDIVTICVPEEPLYHYISTTTFNYTDDMCGEFVVATTARYTKMFPYEAYTTQHVITLDVTTPSDDRMRIAVYKGLAASK